LKIDRIGYPELQKSINVDMGARRVRLDVYVKDDRVKMNQPVVASCPKSEIVRRFQYIC